MGALLLKWVVWPAIDNWKIVLPIVLGFVLLIAGYFYVQNWREDRKEEQYNELEANTTNSQLDVWIREQDRKDAEIEAGKAGNKANEALRDVNSARDRDSSNGNGDYGAAKRRFCEAYPNDSMCR